MKKEDFDNVQGLPYWWNGVSYKKNLGKKDKEKKDLTKVQDKLPQCLVYVEDFNQLGRLKV